MRRQVVLIISCILTCSVCAAVIRFWIYFNQIQPLPVATDKPHFRESWDESQDDFVLKKLLEISIHIARAHRYARSAKVLSELNRAHKKVNEVLQLIYESPTNINLTNELNSPEATESKEVCPEVWPAEGETIGKFDFPFYFKGYRTSDCGLSRPVESLVTLLLNFMNNRNATEIDRYLKLIGSGLTFSYPNLTVIAAIRSSELKMLDTTAYASSLSFLNLRPGNGITEGQVWRRLASKVGTKYLIVGRDLIYFDNMTVMERLVRIISTTKASIVAGSYRDSDGLWHSSCYQMAVKNYTLRLVEGYDLSYKSCLYCEYSNAPFLTKTTLIAELLDKTLSGFPLFLDFFFKIRSKLLPPLLCPDVMFYCHKNSFLSPQNLAKKELLPIAKNEKLNRVILPDNTKFSYNCSEVDINCADYYQLKGIAMPICCIEELSEGLQFLVKQLNKHHIRYEILAGTTVGAIKLNGILPWERDGDIYFHVKDYDKILKKLTPSLNQSGYQLANYPEEFRDNITCMRHMSKPCGYFSLKLPNWEVALWGLLELSTNVWNGSQLLPTTFTKVQIGSVWASTFPNPAQATRNVYGDDIFKHLEHQSQLGGGSNNIYETGTWRKCKLRGFHGCLTNFLPSGNLQFKEIWV